MDLSTEEFVTNLLSTETEEQPSDDVKPEDIVMRLPEWFDEDKYNRGCKFYSNNSFAIFSSLIMGTIAVFAIPSILRVLVSTKRSNSVYTAYRRYFSTLLHIVSWFENELKPGSLSWKSLHAVRKGHVRVSRLAKIKGIGIVSQRDVALTQYCTVGFAILNPDAFGIAQTKESDWEGFNHHWSVIGHMLGLEDKYNVCRKTMDETREVFQMLQDRVLVPYLNNPPEYFEHIARVLIDGMWYIIPLVNEDAVLFMCKSLVNIPGYVSTETQRIQLQKKIKQKLNGKSLETGVESTLLIQKPAVNDIVNQAPRLLYYRDYETLHMTPEFRKLDFTAKFKLVLLKLCMILCSFPLGRFFVNLYFQLSVIVFRYFPILAFFRFGIKESLVNIFETGPIDNTKPKPNDFYNKL